MNARKLRFRDSSSVSRGLLSVVSLAQGEAQRAMIAIQRRGLPPELGGGAREEWQGESESESDGPDPITDGVSTYDVGMYQAIAGNAVVFLESLDLSDRAQLAEIRTLFGIMQQLCRERLSQQADAKSVAARGWRYLGNQIVQALTTIAEIDRVLPDIQVPFREQPKGHPDFHVRGRRSPRQNGDIV